MKASILFFCLSALAAAAPVPPYQQCGGLFYVGPKVCSTGYICTRLSIWRSECLPRPLTTDPITTRTPTSGGGVITRTPTSDGGVITRTPTSDGGVITRTPTSDPAPTTRNPTSDPLPTTREPTTDTPPTTREPTTDAPPTTRDPTLPPTTEAPTSTEEPTTSEAPTTTTSPGICSGSAPAKKFKFSGVNLAGAEFGTALPGVLDKDYTWPRVSSVDYFLEQGFNTFRVQTKMERISQQGIDGPFDEIYIGALHNLAKYITEKDAYIIIDPHNYGRFHDEIITDTAAFGGWCKRLAAEFKQYGDRLVFDTNNEYHTMPDQTVFDLNQECINGIRAADATQIILVEGNQWSGAHSWTTWSNNSRFMGDLKDPNDNIIFQMHQYLDTDSSGTNGTCVSTTVLAERLVEATKWLKERGFKGFLGEVGAGNNDDCIEALKGGLCYLAEHADTWAGFAWWAAGEWWGDYFMSIQPPNGPAVARILPEALKPFF